MQQHYLPKTYLKHFQYPNRPGKVWFYRRHKDPVLVGIGKVAKEKDIYEFHDRHRRDVTQVEAIFARVESDVTPILNRLNEFSPETALSDQEKVTLAWFTAYMQVRTPAMRQTAYDLLVQVTRDAAESLGAESQPPPLTERDGKLRKMAMGVALSWSEGRAEQLMRLGIELLHSDDVPFILPDRPASVVNPPPGLALSGFYELFLPIGSHTALLWSSLIEPSAPLRRRKVKEQNATAINASSMAMSHEFIILCREDSNLANAFSMTAELPSISVEEFQGDIGDVDLRQFN